MRTNSKGKLALVSSTPKVPVERAQAARQTIANAAIAKDTPERPYEVRSTKVRGLLLRVEPSGKRSFYVQTGRGKRHRIGLAGVYTLRQAEVKAQTILRDPVAHAASKAKTASTVTLRAFVADEYEAHALARLKGGQASIARVRAAWSSLLDKPMTGITERDIDALRTRRLNEGIKPSTINRDVAALGGVFTHWAKLNKATHPLAGMDKLRVADDQRVRWLTTDEMARLRAALVARDAAAAEERRTANAWRSERRLDLMPEITGYSDHLHPMVLLSLNTGIRKGELFSMTWEQIDMTNRVLTVIASNSKGKRTRSIPLNPEAMSVLTAIKPEHARGLVFPSPVTGGRFDNVQTAEENLTAAAELEDFTWHDMRHHFASMLVMKGVSLYTVQNLLGHATPAMTMRYARLAPSNLSDAVALL